MLCETALELLLTSRAVAGLPLEVIDVTADEALFERYASRVPVFRAALVADRMADGMADDSEPGSIELAWPFDEKVLAAALKDLLTITP